MVWVAAAVTMIGLVALPAPSALAANSKSVKTVNWFHDPLSAAQRRAEIPIPANPVAYRGPLVHTKARYRTHNRSIAVPIPWADGHTLVAGQALVLTPPGLFTYGGATLNKTAKRELLALQGSLSRVISIKCQGYADYGPPPAFLHTLSVKRAKVTCAALKADKPSIRTTTIGYGGTFPVIVGGTAAQRAQNRRVVIVITRSSPAA
jgi:outer membrane protein OmpA-like peptidoglycan-associated protein